MNNTHDQINTWLFRRAEGAQLNDAGVAAVQRDSQTVVVIELATDGSHCHLSSLIRPVGDTERGQILATALELNRFGKPLAGCWIAWEADLDSLLLCHNLGLAEIDEIAFNHVLDNFIAAIDVSRAQLDMHTDRTTAREMLER